MISLWHFSSGVTFCLSKNASQVEFPMGVIGADGNSTCLCSGRSSWGGALCDFGEFGSFKALDFAPELSQVCGGETGTSSIDDFMALDTAERFSPVES